VAFSEILNFKDHLSHTCTKKLSKDLANANWFWVGEIHFLLPMMAAVSYDLVAALYFELEYSELLWNNLTSYKNSVFTGYSILETPYNQI
jgi:hypothetical protein